MENLCGEIFQKTGTPIVVATLSTIGGNDMRHFTTNLYNAWGIGKKGVNKGVLILVAVKEKSVRIVTGTGSEDVLPDGLWGEILDKYMIPHFKGGITARPLPVVWRLLAIF